MCPAIRRTYRLADGGASATIGRVACQIPTVATCQPIKAGKAPAHPWGQTGQGAWPGCSKQFFQPIQILPSVPVSRHFQGTHGCCVSSLLLCDSVETYSLLAVWASSEMKGGHSHYQQRKYNKWQISRTCRCGMTSAKTRV